jgi:plasmid stabilization system protein ParE
MLKQRVRRSEALEVVIRPIVREHIADPIRYIARHSIDNALKWDDRLQAVLNALGSFHGHAIDVEASRRAGYTVHKFVFEGTYLIHYRVDAALAQVEVVNFRHGARLPRRNEP